MISVFAALGTISTLRDNFFPQADIAIINWIPPLNWYGWVIAVLILSFFFALEGGYRVQERLNGQSTNERQRVISLLGKRLSVGDEALGISLVATIWLGRDHGDDTNAQLEWNYRFRLLKQAVSKGEIQALNLQQGEPPSLTTIADTRSLIRFFSSGSGSR